MKRKGFASTLLLLMMVFIVVSVSYASDSASGTFTFNPYLQALYNNKLEYIDVRCGMNTRGVYNAYTKGPYQSSPNIDRIGLSYQLTGIGGTNLGGDSIHLNNSNSATRTSPINVIESSNATFTFETSDGSWYPNSVLYHCMEWSSTESENSFVSNIQDSDEINAKAFESFKRNDNTLEYLGLSLSDFKVSEVQTYLSSHQYENKNFGLKFNFEKSSDLVMVLLNSTTEIVKDDKIFAVYGYVLFNKENNQIETGIFTKPKE